MCVASYYNWLNSVCQNGNDLQNWNNALTQLSARIFVAVCNILPARDIRYGIARIWAYNVPAAVPACRNCEEYTAHKAEILKKGMQSPVAFRCQQAKHFEKFVFFGRTAAIHEFLFFRSGRFRRGKWWQLNGRCLLKCRRRKSRANWSDILYPL